MWHAFQRSQLTAISAKIQLRERNANLFLASDEIKHFLWLQQRRHFWLSSFCLRNDHTSSYVIAFFSAFVSIAPLLFIHEHLWIAFLLSSSSLFLHNQEKFVCTIACIFSPLPLSQAVMMCFIRMPVWAVCYAFTLFTPFHKNQHLIRNSYCILVHFKPVLCKISTNQSTKWVSHLFCKHYNSLIKQRQTPVSVDIATALQPLGLFMFNI